MNTAVKEVMKEADVRIYSVIRVTNDGLIRCRVPRGRPMSKVEISVQVEGRW